MRGIAAARWSPYSSTDTKRTEGNASRPLKKYPVPLQMTFITTLDPACSWLDAGARARRASRTDRYTRWPDPKSSSVCPSLTSSSGRCGSKNRTLPECVVTAEKGLKHTTRHATHVWGPWS